MIRLTTLFCVLLSVAGCASGPERLDTGRRVDVPAVGPEPGPAEAQILAYLEELTELLGDLDQEPEEVVGAVEAYLETNREVIVAATQQLADRIATFDASELEYYEEHFAEYFGPARLAWNDALGRFLGAHPAAGRRIRGLVRHFD